MGLKSSQVLVEYYLVGHKLCPNLPCKQYDIVAKGCGWLCIYATFLIACRNTFLYQRCWNIGIKALCRHQLNLSTQYMFIFSNSALLSVCGEQPVNCLGKKPGLFGGSHGTPLNNNSIRCNPTLVLETLFCDKRCWVGTLSSPFFGDFICIYLKTSISFSYSPSVLLYFSCLSLYYLHNSSFLSSHLTLPAQPYLHDFPFANEIYVFPLVPHSIATFCGL